MFLNWRRPDINKGVEEFRAADSAVLIDVRTREEYMQGHIPGSQNISLDRIEAAAPMFKNKTVPLYIYCLSGARSDAAAKILKGMGYTAVKNIGGFRSYTGTVETGSPR